MKSKAGKQTKIKVLYIHHAAAYPEERKKFEYLAQQPELDIMLIQPKQWAQIGREENFRSLKQNTAFKTVHANALFRNYHHRSFFINKIRAVFKNFQPDIIHLFEEANTFFSLQAVICKRLFAPHSKLIFDNFQNVLFEHAEFKFHQFYDYIEKKVFEEAVCATVRYSGSRDYLTHRNFQKPIYELPWGVDLSLFSRKNPDIIQQKYDLAGFSLAYIGRIEEEKGVLFLINALSELEKDFRLLIIGGGLAEKKMLRMISELNLSHKIHYIGYVPHQELPVYYSAVNCVVVPTISTPGFQEQFGRVIVESMACGTPVIGSTSGAIPSVIGDAGLVFEENNMAALIQNLETMINIPSLVKEFSQKATERARNVFCLEKFSENCLNIYKEVIPK